MIPQSTKVLYSQKMDDYAAKLKSPKFCNNSSGVKGLFGAAENSYSTSKAEHAARLQERMSKL